MVWGGDGYTGAHRNIRTGGGESPKCPHMYKKGPPYVQKGPNMYKKGPPYIQKKIKWRKSSKNANTLLKKEVPIRMKT